MTTPDGTPEAQWREAARWFAYADEDLRVAEHCLAAEQPLLGPSAYHCQQAAEKLIKGLLIAAAKPIPRVHDLKFLSACAAPEYPELKDLMLALRELTVWGLAYRYPAEEEGAAEPPTLQTLRQAIEDIRVLYSAASQRLQL